MFFKNKGKIKSLEKNIAKKTIKTKFIDNKKRIFLLSMCSVITTVPITVGISSILKDKHLAIEGIIQKEQQNSIITPYEKEVNSYWKLIINDEKNPNNKEVKIFNNATDLRREVLSKYIETQNVVSSLNLSEMVDFNTGKLLISNEQLAQVVNDTNNTKVLEVFKTNKNSFTKNQEQAYASYFDAKDAYYFNNIYFNSKEDLRSYLINNYLPNNTNKTFNSFVIEAPNGAKSNPISTDAANSNNSINYLKKFIDANLTSLVKYTKTNADGTKEDILISNENISRQVNKINIKDIPYQHVYSNEGESRYVVDNMYTDDNNLIGPYFYEGNLDIGGFTNVDMWRKTNGINKSAYVQSKIDTTIGLFFNTITNDDNITTLNEMAIDGKNPPIFNTPIVNSFGRSIDEEFISNIVALSPKLANAIFDINKSLMQSKKYNSFYKVPIMYNAIMNRIVSWNLSNDVYNLVINYFTQVTQFMQNTLEVATLYNDKLLVGRDGTKLDLTKFFQIGNPEYDINTTTSYFLDELKTNYPKLVATITVFNEAMTNLFLAAGMIPFSAFSPKILYDFKIITEIEYQEILPTLESVYNIFSQLDYNSMAKLFINSAAPYHSEINKILSLAQSEQIAAFDKLLTTDKLCEISLILKAIGLRNTNNYLKAQSLLITELKLFFQRGQIIVGGYLYKIRDVEYDRIMSLVNYALENPENNDIYKRYLALLIDAEMRTKIFHSSMVSNPAALAQVISRLTFGVLATAGGVGTLVKNVYGNAHSNPSINRNPLVFDGISLAESTSVYGLDSSINMFGSDDEDQWFTASRVLTTDIKDKIQNIELNKIQRVLGKTPLDQDAQNRLSQQWEVSRELKNRLSVRVSIDPNQSNRIDIADVTVGNQSNYTGEPIYAVVNKRPGQPPVPPSTSPPPLTPTPPTTPLPDVPDLPSPPTTPLPDVPDLPSPPTTPLPDVEYPPVSPPPPPIPPIDYPQPPTNNGQRPPTPPIDYPQPPSTDPTPPTTPDLPSRPGSSAGSSHPDFDGSNLSIPDPTNQANKTSKKTFQTSNIKDGEGISSNKQSKTKWLKNDFVRKVSDKTTAIFEAIGRNFFELLGGAFAIAEFVFVIFDFLKVEEIQDFYVYTTIDGTEFIWDGGKTVSRYFGFKTETVNSFNSSVLIKPIQITLPQIEEYYYLNQTKYYDAESLKRSFINSLLNSNSTVQYKNFSKQYTFSKLNGEAGYNYAYNTKNDVLASVLNNLNITESSGVFDLSNINTSSEYIVNTSYGFSNGMHTNSSNTINVIADNIIDNIRKTKITKKVKKDVTGAILDKDNSFVLPGVSYKGGAFVDNTEKLNEYIIDNSANELKSTEGQIINGNITSDMYVIPDIKTAENESLKKLYTTFKTTFEPEKKQILESLYFVTNKYSELATAKNKFKIYKVKAIGNISSAGFIDAYSAEKYLFKYFENNNLIQKVSTTVIEKHIQYNGYVFDTEDEFRKFITANYKLKGW